MENLNVVVSRRLIPCERSSADNAQAWVFAVPAFMEIELDNDGTTARRRGAQ